LHRTTPRWLSTTLFCSVVLLIGCNRQPQLVEQRLLEFGTIIDISIIHEDVDKAEKALLQAEQQLKRYRTYWHAWEDSDLYRFNQALDKSQPALVTEPLIELIQLSQQYYQSSQHLFNPALGKLIAAYGFHGEANPDLALISTIQKDLPGMPDLKIKNGMAISDNPHLQLDFGGIAKGYAIALVADELKRSGFKHFLINAGGDVLIYGNRFGKPWRIGVQNPFAPGAIASIELSGNQNLFTSGNYQRFYRKDGGIVHHIIDPRTGKPSTQVTSATVLADDAVLADVGATTLMIDGWQDHASLAESLGISDYLLIDANLNVIVSRNLAAKLEFTSDVSVTIAGDTPSNLAK